MKNLIRLLLFIFIIALSFESKAQLGNRLKQAASKGLGNALEKRVEKEAEKIAQRQLEKAFQDIYGPEMPSGGGFDMNKILEGISMDVETASEYRFQGYSNMLIKSTDENGKTQDPFQMKTFFDQDGKTVAMEFENRDKNSSGKTILIYDLERNASIFLLDANGEKSSMAYAYDFTKMTENGDFEDWEKDLENENFELKKTGNKKIIHGYGCEEYVADSEDGIATYWITDKPIEGSAAFWGQSNPLINFSNYQSKSMENIPNGHMMEMYFESKLDQSKSEITITEINDTSKITFDIQEYPNILKSKQ
ncbi:hypothetical protein Belba_3551 [Belliella baltica DSM 15883]|uniref:DUF4412 domain-containing protein n=1 Tax=Belliella baltica (strain DSM 15883 / CIP 108006 / LMG 21964 / BA134) TaxID=866536 RepID=I3Z9Y1_BELBD|nr:DUF4412 domain-containing protein [Belliella baltica]AFL86049.1 hypothetical protein Belba_3551 [Belliella baltica DSM 15883]